MRAYAAAAAAEEEAGHGASSAALGGKKNSLASLLGGGAGCGARTGGVARNGHGAHMKCARSAHEVRMKGA